MSLITDIQAKIDTKNEEIAWMGDHIVLKDTEKEKWDNAILRVDSHTSKQIEAVNTTILDVGSAYKDRINVGCRTDLFWRVVGHTTADPAASPSPTSETWTLECTQMNVIGYAGTGTVGPSTSLTLYNGGVSGVTTYPLTSKYGFSTDFYHGIKYYNEPWTEDIGDTTVGSFIGTVGSGTTVLTIMQPNSQGLADAFRVGQLVTCEKDGVISGTHNTIVGFGTAVVDLTGISTVGMAVTEVTTIILGTLVSGFASIPPYGNYVDFTVSDDPVSISTYSDYAISWAKNPMSPQTIGMMGSGPLGIGTAVVYDNSGISSNTQSWKPEFRTDQLPSKVQSKMDDDDKVDPPNVGAGRSHYWVGFTSTPALLSGDPAEVGDIRVITTTFFGNTLYNNLPTCPTQETNLTNKISIRDNLEAEFASGVSTFNNTVGASVALRKEKNSLDQQIWGIRMTIGQSLSDISEYESLQNYINTYPEIIEPD